LGSDRDIQQLLVKHGEILKIWHTFKSSPFSELKTLIKNASEFSILNETTLLTNNNKLWRLNENNCVLINSLEKTSHQTSRVTANQEFAYIPTYQEKIPRLQPVLEKFWQLRFFITADRKVRPLIHHVDLKSHGLKTTLLDIPELPMEYTDIDVLMPVKGILSRTGDIFYIFCESFFLDSFNLLPSGDRIDMLLTYDTKTNKPLGPAITLKKTAPNCFYYPIDTIGDFIILDYVNNSVWPNSSGILVFPFSR